jgi:ribulose-5-phosphate 4-epimerase/fuculose-1-phosphate aldolase
MATELREEVAEAARVLARLGLVTAFGHVSARAGDAMLITPAADLADVTADRVVEVPLGSREGPLPPGAPAEAWAHLALYRARPDAACDVYLKALAASGANPVTPLAAGEIASWRAVSGELLPRLWQHLRRRPSPGQTPSGLRPSGADPGEVQG